MSPRCHRTKAARNPWDPYSPHSRALLAILAIQSCADSKVTWYFNDLTYHMTIFFPILILTCHNKCTIYRPLERNCSLYIQYSLAAPHSRIKLPVFVSLEDEMEWNNWSMIFITCCMIHFTAFWVIYISQKLSVLNKSGSSMKTENWSSVNMSDTDRIWLYQLNKQGVKIEREKMW